MSDPFKSSLAGIISPAENAFVITPSNTVDLEIATRGIYVGVSGDVKVDMVSSGLAVTFVGLAAGVIHPIRCRRVYASDTSATSILGVY